MLRDNAIRQGLMPPSKEDVKRMNITDDELFKLSEKREKIAAAKAAKAAKDTPAVPEPPVPAGAGAAVEGSGKKAGK